IFIDPEALKGRSILVVEDNEFNRFIARSILVKWNIRVDMAANGREAIDMVRQKSYDLILMDMQMPELDGYSATTIIRKELGITTKVIALTAFATKEAIDRSYEAGMNGYITKPFEEETLFATLLSAFDIPPRYVTDQAEHFPAAATRVARHEVHYDLDKLSTLLDGDQAEIIDLIEKFIEVTPGFSDSLLRAFDQNNIDGIAKAAHKIKSSIDLLASGNLRSNINLIHDYALTGKNLEKLPKLVKYFRENIPVLLQQLQEKAEELKEELGSS
ncbi:MAG: response regulator, partial [Bacteroidota bacterium]